MSLLECDKDFIQAMFRDNCTTATVRKVFPRAFKSTIRWHKANFDCFGTVSKPDSAKKQRGRPNKITPLMREWLIYLLSFRNDLWEEELVFESWCKFDLTVDRSTISRLLTDEALTSKVNTRIASRRDSAQEGVY